MCCVMSRACPTHLGRLGMQVRNAQAGRPDGHYRQSKLTNMFRTSVLQRTSLPFALF